MPAGASLVERAVRLGYLGANVSNVSTPRYSAKNMAENEYFLLDVDDLAVQKIRLLINTVFHSWYRFAAHRRMERLLARTVTEAANRRRLIAVLRKWVYLTPLTKHRIVTWMEKKYLSRPFARWFSSLERNGLLLDPIATNGDR